MTTPTFRDTVRHLQAATGLPRRTVADTTALLLCAATLRRHETDYFRQAWLTGYMRGLRRARDGERFGSAEEHAAWLAAADSDYPPSAARGEGYRAGLAGVDPAMALNNGR